jgi:hypothetical protein
MTTIERLVSEQSALQQHSRFDSGYPSIHPLYLESIDLLLASAFQFPNGSQGLCFSQLLNICRHRLAAAIETTGSLITELETDLEHLRGIESRGPYESCRRLQSDINGRLWVLCREKELLALLIELLCICHFPEGASVQRQKWLCSARMRCRMIEWCVSIHSRARYGITAAGRQCEHLDRVREVGRTAAEVRRLVESAELHLRGLVSGEALVATSDRELKSSNAFWRCTCEILLKSSIDAIRRLNSQGTVTDTTTASNTAALVIGTNSVASIGGVVLRNSVLKGTLTAMTNAISNAALAFVARRSNTLSGIRFMVDASSSTRLFTRRIPRQPLWESGWADVSSEYDWGFMGEPGRSVWLSRSETSSRVAFLSPQAQRGPNAPALISAIGQIGTDLSRSRSGQTATEHLDGPGTDNRFRLIFRSRSSSIDETLSLASTPSFSALFPVTPKQKSCWWPQFSTVAFRVDCSMSETAA